MIYDNLCNIPGRYKKSIMEAVDVILSYNIPDLQSIRLFGGCARLNLHVGSDIDIAIILSKPLCDRRLSGGLRSDVDDLSTKIGCDLVIMHEEVLKEQKSKLSQNIQRDGIILWEGGKTTDDFEQLLCNCEG